MPNHVVTPNRHVGALLYEGACNFELGIVAEIFGVRRPELGADWYTLVTVAEEAGPVRGTGGLTVVPEAGLEALADASTIVIPGWPPDGQPPSPAVAKALTDAHARGARIASICSGAFLLASCGLLDGKRATTHWMFAERLKQLFPRVRVDADVLYVDEGQILTSAGSAAGVDLLLHIVRLDFGARVANEIARRMVMPPHREGGQAQFIARPLAPCRGDRLAPLMEQIRVLPSVNWTVARMSREAAMSERTLIRRFREATGMPPGKWVIAVRIEAAKFLLETSSASLEDVATVVGFASVGTFRHHFRAHVGLPPSSYRARFRDHLQSNGGHRLLAA